MNMNLLALTLLLFSVNLSFGTKNVFLDRSAGKKPRTLTDGDAGEPLILTPLLQENKIEEAQAAALVNNSVFGDVVSYSGYFTVDEAYESNLFFWFFPAFQDYENAPVVVWLQGGPGSTSMFGLFEENGPFSFKSASELEFPENTWVKYHSVIYIDNPAGTGFSFTNGGYALNQTKVGEGLYSALQQFFTLFPNLRQNDFYVTGESYGGKYVPAISYTILKNNAEAEPEQQINLKGLAMGNGLSNPKYQFIYGEHLYQLGLIDSNTRDEFIKYEQQFVEAVDNEDWETALYITSDILLGGPYSLFWNATGFDNVYNLLYDVDTYDAIHDGYMYEFFDNADIRKSIHVGNTPFGDPQSGESLQFDIPKSIAPWVSELLSNYRVLYYNGQLDLIVPYTQTVEYLQNLEFSSADEYKVAERHIWYVGEDLAGYVKTAGNLTEVLVRNAGHMVPGDQPVWALDMITKFTRNQPIYSDE